MNARPTLRRILSIAVGVSALALAACTSTVAEVDPGGGGNGAGGHGAGGAGGGGAGPVCSDFDDTTEQTDVTVTVRNDTSEPVYLTGVECEPQLDLRLYDENDERVSFRPGSCHFTCEELQESDPVCPAGCALPPIVMIAPGGSYELGWSGTVHEPVAMPAACYLTPDAATDTCDQRVVAPAGAYAFEVVGYDDSWCPLDQPGACECQPDASGSCTVEPYGELPAGAGVPARGSLSFPNDTAVEIVFE